MNDESPQSRTLQFSALQNVIITRSITLFAVTGMVVVLWWCGSILVTFVGRHSNVLLPPVVAVVLSMLLRPLYERLRGWLWKSHALSVVVLSLLILVPIVLLLRYFGLFVIRQGYEIFQALPEYAQRLSDWMGERAPEMQAFIQENIPLLSPAALAEMPSHQLFDLLHRSGVTVGGQVLAFFSNLVGWLLLPIYTVIFLATRPLDGNDVRELLSFASPKLRDNVGFLVDQFLEIVVTFFRGQVLVAGLLGLYYGLAYQLIGMPYGFIIGITQGFLNVVPYLGNLIGIILSVPLTIASGNVTLGILWACAFLIGQVLDGYVITPHIMKNRTGLNTFVIIFSLFFWHAIIGGLIGLILAIPLSAFVVVFWRLLQREYFPKK